MTTKFVMCTFVGRCSGSIGLVSGQEHTLELSVPVTYENISKALYQAGYNSISNIEWTEAKQPTAVPVKAYELTSLPQIDMTCKHFGVMTVVGEKEEPVCVCYCGGGPSSAANAKLIADLMNNRPEFIKEPEYVQDMRERHDLYRNELVDLHTALGCPTDNLRAVVELTDKVVKLQEDLRQECLKRLHFEGQQSELQQYKRAYLELKSKLFSL